MGSDASPRAIDGGRASQAAAALLGRLERGELAVGDRLPSERELSRQLGASRATVRQAIQRLEARGLLEVRDRAGAFVRPPSAAPAGEALLLLVSRAAEGVRVRDLVEVRQVLEVELAGLAAERRTPEQLRALGRALADTGSAEEAAAWAAADVDFHGALARATGNPLFALLYDALRAILVEQRLRTGTLLPETPARSFRYHQRIFDRVAAGDAAGARRAMREHLREARQTLLRSADALDAGFGAPLAAPAVGE